VLVRILTTIAGSVTVGFGFWHFFVPTIWHWDSYIDAKAAELVRAIHALNIFFSLSLVLIGVMNIILIWRSESDRFSILIVLSVSVVLWVTRSILQITHPQGSIRPVLRYGMLFTFLFVTLLYTGSFVLTVVNKSLL
jgi:hypothetical protein